MQILEREAALFLCIEAKIHKIKKKCEFQDLIATLKKYLFRSLLTKNPESIAFRIFSFVPQAQHHLRGTRNIICALAQHHCRLARHK